ncbi:hypothetical protein GCM10008107_31750 [Psychrosphaera saromensis]|uniref:DUF3301 domain-containing protein n=1 Tax=Psychrosphaera saromensis TaxID=716813 RepID=A0A2S7UWI8_9GAMM|nr:DUF3301 domain-containing protein [Psychrosphaera saromensis]PQJ54139.1 hypothetical protein BTO11_11100 [Psychrosphaera saromensis]GHB79945.1 hypothetical protein GCM10008107_31750 [Psychrosphaera saromensis]GLQ12786.1 hypothetical protein GCM10007917_02410 [Psychrosphaera saromensis]
MFDLTTVWLIMFFACIVVVFLQFRKLAEIAESAAKGYCERYHLQLLSVPMQSWKVGFNKKLIIKASFILNYSGDGLSAKKGEIILHNGKVEHIHHWG